MKCDAFLWELFWCAAQLEEFCSLRIAGFNLFPTLPIKQNCISVDSLRCLWDAQVFHKKQKPQKNQCAAVYAVCLTICVYVGYKQNQSSLSFCIWAARSGPPPAISQPAVHCVQRSLKCCSSWTTQMVRAEGLDKTMPKAVLTFYQYRPISCAQEHAVAWFNIPMHTLSLCFLLDFGLTYAGNITVISDVKQYITYQSVLEWNKKNIYILKFIKVYFLSLLFFLYFTSYLSICLLCIHFQISPFALLPYIPHVL